MTKEELSVHQQKLIRNYNTNLFRIDMKIRQGVTGSELTALERLRIRYIARLAKLYGIEESEVTVH